MEFWRTNESKFPNCARLARKILAIPATVNTTLPSDILSHDKLENVNEYLQRTNLKSIVDLGTLLPLWV